MNSTVENLMIYVMPQAPGYWIRMADIKFNYVIWLVVNCAVDGADTCDTYV